MPEQSSVGTGRLLLGLLSYVLAFAVPITVLALFVPASAGPIVLGGAAVFVGVSAFCSGREWDGSEWTRDAKSFARWLPVLLLMGPIGDLVCGDTDLLAAGAFTGALAMTVYPPFFLGRWLRRLRTRGANVRM